MVGSIVVIGAQTRYALLHSMCDFKKTQIRSLITVTYTLQFIAEEATKNFRDVKDNGVVDHCTVTRWFNKFRIG